jgi:hypothetical protein
MSLPSDKSTLIGFGLISVNALICGRIVDFEAVVEVDYEIIRPFVLTNKDTGECVYGQ